MIELVEEGSALAQLPFVRWARRFRGGTVRLQGRFDGRPLPGVRVEEGDVEVAFTFTGGRTPKIDELALLGRVGHRSSSGGTLDLDPDQTVLDGVVVDGPFRMDQVVEELVGGLSDVEAWVEALPEGELLVKFPAGVVATLAASAVVTLEGTTHGPPGSLCLSGPLQMRVNGAGMCLSHRRFHRLASLASVSLEGAELHPNGDVRLSGKANGSLDRMVKGGLRRASARLSDLVKRSPRFASVRTFLRQSSSGS